MSVLTRFIVSIVVITTVVLVLWGLWKPDKEPQFITFRFMDEEADVGSYTVYRTGGEGNLNVVGSGTCPANMSIEEIYDCWLKHDKRLTYSGINDVNDIAVMRIDTW